MDWLSFYERCAMLLPASTPQWLTALTSEAITHGPFPLRHLLAQSLFYPAAGNDANPIAMLSRHVPSFIHVDYSRTEADIHASLTSRNCFRGYDLVGLRNVKKQELLPLNSHSPLLFTGPMVRSMPEYVAPENAFARWAVFERRASYDSLHGAARFSFLHLNAEGVAAYDALYRGQGVQAQFLAIVQPGEVFGDNWTRFTEPGWALHHAVSQHPAGMPRYLVYGGGRTVQFYTQRACWPEYSQLVSSKAFTAGHQAALTVWAHKKNVPPPSA